MYIIVESLVEIVSIKEIIHHEPNSITYLTNNNSNNM